MKTGKLVTAIRLILTTTSGNREIGREAGVSYNTVRRYREAIADRKLLREDLEGLSEDALESIFNKRVGTKSKKRPPDWTYIHRELQRKGVTRTLLWMEYKEEDPGTAYGLSQFNQLYAQWAGKHRLSMRQQHDPGERGWVDFSGTTMSWVNPNTGEVHDAQVFVASTGVSGLLYAFAVPSQKQEHWIEAHCQWYEFLGGVPRITVPDNLKSAVQKSGRDPILNPAYLDMAEHYGTFILPARSRTPQDKSKVENAVLIFLRWGIARLRKKVFHSLAEVNIAISECVEVINRRPMRLYQQSRRERFDAIDKAALMPLPVRYQYAEWYGPYRVPPDYHIKIKNHFYSVPYRLVQQEVHARCTPSTVEIICDRTRIASHSRSEVVGGKTTERGHMPEHHLAWADHTPERYLTWAQTIGPKALIVIERLLSDARHPAGALNACANLQKLARKYTAQRFERACIKAIEIQSTTVKSIRSILQHGLESRHGEIPRQGRLPMHPNIRGADYYQDQEKFSC